MTLRSYDIAGPNPRPISVTEVDVLKALVARLPINPIIVQIGAGVGVSTLAMLEARKDATIFSVDIGECEQEFENLRLAGFERYKYGVYRVLGRSQDIGLTWGVQCHMLFIDGDHSEAGVRGDILAWRDKVVSGGIIAFHDYIPEPIPPEIKGRVVYAVDDLMKGYEEILWMERIKAFYQP